MAVNQADRDYHKAGSPQVDPIAVALREGYEDYRLGQLRDRLEIVGWEDGRQLNYEAGRRLAALLKRYCRLPPWPVEVTFSTLSFDLPDRAVEEFYAEDALTHHSRGEPYGPPRPAERHRRARGRAPGSAKALRAEARRLAGHGAAG